MNSTRSPLLGMAHPLLPVLPPLRPPCPVSAFLPVLCQSSLHSLGWRPSSPRGVSLTWHEGKDKCLELVSHPHPLSASTTPAPPLVPKLVSIFPPVSCQFLPINSFPDQFNYSSFLLFPTKALAGHPPCKVVLDHSQGLPCSCPFSGVQEPPLQKDEPPGPVQESTQQARDTVLRQRGGECACGEGSHMGGPQPSAQL